MLERILTYRTGCTDPYRNLAVEQHLLESVPEGVCILYLWQNRRTVVIGCNQSPWKECRTAALEADGGFLARRLSGGGAVFHDLGNLNFTFLMHKGDYSLSRQLAVIVEACRSIGVPAACAGRNDVLAGGRKFSGSAFCERGGRRYHHGTLLVDADLSAMGAYLSPSRAKLASKGVASVRSRVVNLKELRPGLTVEEMARQMEAAFQSVYGLTAERLKEGVLDWETVDALAAHNASWAWLYGRDLACTFQCGDRFAWGEVELRLAVEGGIITQAAVYTDAMDCSAAPAVERAVTGRRFRMEDIRRGLCSAGLERGMQEDLCRLLAAQDI